MSERLREALSGSWLASTLGPHGGVVPNGGTVVDGSVLLRVTRAAQRTLAAAGDRSMVGRVAASLGTLARESFCYRWLTKEPEPDVVVIDLRETVTVGPVVAVVERLATWFSPRWRASGTWRAACWLARTLGPAAENAVVTDVLASVLAPLEPNDSVRDDPSASDND